MSKLEFRVLVELFAISRLQRASPQSVRAVSVHFVPVRNCITSGIVLLDYTGTCVCVCLRVVVTCHVL